MGKRRTTEGEREDPPKTGGGRRARARRDDARSRFRRRLVVGLAAAAVLVVATCLLTLPSRIRSGSGGHRVVAPATIDALEPQLRAPIREQLERVEKAPNDAAVRGVLGAIYEANGLWDDAVRTYAEAESLDAREIIWPLHRAASLDAGGDRAASLALLRRLTQKFPEAPVVHGALAEQLLVAGDLAGAGESFEVVVRRAPKLSLGYIGLADVRVRQGRPADALTLCDQALALDPGNRSARHVRGLALRDLGRPDEARHDLAIGQGVHRPVLRDEWSNGLAQHVARLDFELVAGSQYEAAGNLEAAEAVLRKALQYHPTNLVALNNLAYVLQRQGRIDEAISLLERADPSDAGYAIVLRTLAGCHEQRNELDLALSLLDRSIALAPMNRLGFVRKASLLVKMHRVPEALQAFDLAIDLDPKNAEMRRDFGRLLSAEGYPEPAHEQYRVAADLLIDEAQAQQDWFDSALRVGRIDEATLALRRVTELEPNDPEVARLSALLRGRQGGKDARR